MRDDLGNDRPADEAGAPVCTVCRETGSLGCASGTFSDKGDRMQWRKQRTPPRPAGMTWVPDLLVGAPTACLLLPWWPRKHRTLP